MREQGGLFRERDQRELCGVQIGERGIPVDPQLRSVSRPSGPPSQLSVLLLADVIRIASPDGLRLVQFLILSILLLHGLLFLSFLLSTLLIVLHILNLWLVFFLAFLFLFLFLLLLVVRDFLVPLLLHQQLDGITDELRVLLYNLLYLSLLQEFRLVFFEVKSDHRATTKWLSWIWSHCEGPTGRRLPDVLLIVVVL
ncbi:hypothetical protein J437_LFUL013180 [Ladona fulva]|uniref:Uncharacterized protein n=1 Tax=Ladona fulva TaxID=123851 RepID=A0A8K0KG57_LADFU|nr:hypothetical protein J437_LFUL013180 [Ladona fulva]